MLTDKAKTDFWKWYLLPETLDTHKMKSIFKYSSENVIKIGFLAKSETEQNAFIIDFFDSVGIYIEILIEENRSFSIQIFDLNKSKPLESYGTFEKRNQALVEAIEKANKIYNLKQNSNENK